MDNIKLKPLLAEDADLANVKFPCWAQPKIDGVRALNLNGTLTGRSLDPFEGFGITEHFSRPELIGLDGEMTLGNKPNCDQRLCSLTTGAMGRFKGVTEMADLHWWVFDLITPDTIDLVYADRYQLLHQTVRDLEYGNCKIHIVPYVNCDTLAQLQHAVAGFFEDGYEGTIIRNPQALYKQGRATKKNQELWRVKPWADAEIRVTGITEGQMNANEAKTNTLGRTERSSAKAGMVPNGQVGSVQGTLLADFHDPITGRLLFGKGLPVTVGSGEMSVVEATRYFREPHLIIGHVVKFKHMTHGVKDLPRFPTYMTHRLVQDMSL
jgi:DNA ligase-1